MRRATIPARSRARRTVAFGVTVAFATLASCTGDRPGTATVERTAPVISAPAPNATSPIGTAKPGSPPTAAPATPDSLDWTACDKHLECATLTVPADYDDASQGTIDLFVERRRASDRAGRIGSLLVNPGGPGLPGTYMVQQAAGYLSATLLDRFDVVSWDTRGTGRSAPVTCTAPIDSWLALDPTPDTPAERQTLLDASKAFGASCTAGTGEVLRHVSTYDSAHDADQVRRALGEDRVSFLGASYGSQLAATWATLFPDTVRAVVLDGVVNLEADSFTRLREQVVGLERALDAAFDACAADRGCPFHGGDDPASAFDALWRSVDASPVAVNGVEGAPAVNQGVLLFGVVSQLYDSAYRPRLYGALAALEKGNARPMYLLYKSYQTFSGLFPEAFDALMAINCVDDPGPTDPAEIDRNAAELDAVAPRLGRALATVYVCASWPVPGRPVSITGVGAGPMLVVGTTGDPVTPIESARAVAAGLEDGVLLTVTADRHTGYGANECATKVIDDYLLAPSATPAAGTVC